MGTPLLFFAFALIIAIPAIFIMMAASRGSGSPWPSCGGCGYDVTESIESGRCPECGADFRKVGIRPPAPPRTTRRMMPLVVLVCVLGLSAAIAFSLAARARSSADAARAAMLRQQLNPPTDSANIPLAAEPSAETTRSPEDSIDGSGQSQRPPGD